MKFKITLIALVYLTYTAMAAPTHILYCPKSTYLTKDPVKLTWSANQNTFRSYDFSFAKTIDHFVGAQWVGTQVGQITCIYKAFPKTSFPILLIYHALALNPKGGAWTKDLGGYKNCNTLDRKACAFIVQLKPKSINIYEEAKNLKSATPGSLSE